MKRFLKDHWIPILCSIWTAFLLFMTGWDIGRNHLNQRLVQKGVAVYTVDPKTGETFLCVLVPNDNQGRLVRLYK